MAFDIGKDGINIQFLIFMALIPGISFAADAQLLLVRNAKTNTACDAPTFHGALYAIPPYLNLEEVSTTTGLTLLTKTEELPFEDNLSERSAIPAGTYSAVVRTDETKNWMKGNPNRAWRLELKNVKYRSAIQFHYGKDKSWSKGCIILTGNTNNDGLICRSGDQASPEAAVDSIKKYVEGQVRSTNDKIRIRIVEWGN